MNHFIYTVSHDLRSPLTTISNFAREIALDLESGNVGSCREDLEFIIGAARRMGRLLDDLRQVAQAGSCKLRISEFSLAEIAQDAYTSVAGRFTSMGIDFQVHNGEWTIRGDRDRLTGLVQNLFDNAAKYMATQHSPRVEIGIEPTSEGQGIYVRDNGMGIPSDKLSTIFTIFERLASDVEGSGIGLALAKKIVEAHQGRIWAVSAGSVQGASFFFTLGENGIRPPADQSG